jgi:uncharacterized protein YbjT (DUF2867 family)
MRVAVAGGTGVLGSLVVAELTAVGDDPVVLARGAGVDLTTGTGLGAALVGCEAVVDVVNVATPSRRVATRFFTATTRHLLAACEHAAVGHLVTLSIVGVPEVDYGYYLGKRVQEDLVVHGAVPWTLVRATQFHEFPGQVLRAVPGPVAVVPRMRSRPVAASEVAARLVGLVHGEPQGVTQPIAGPEVLEMTDMARRLLAARGERRPVVGFRIPGRVGRAMAGGALVPAEPFDQGTQTFAEYLAGLPGVPR